MNESIFLVDRKWNRAAADEILLHYLYIGGDSDITEQPAYDMPRFGLLQLRTDKGLVTRCGRGKPMKILNFLALSLKRALFENIRFAF